MGWLPVVHVRHVVRLAQLQRGVELFERFQQLFCFAEVDFLDFIDKLDVVAVDFVCLFLTSIWLAVDLDA